MSKTMEGEGDRTQIEQQRERLEDDRERVEADRERIEDERERVEADRERLEDEREDREDHRRRPKHFEIFIDKDRYEVDENELTGLQLRALPSPTVGQDRDLWEEIPGPGDDVKVQDDQVVKIHSGLRFFTTPRHVTPGSIDTPLPIADKSYLASKGHEHEVAFDGGMVCVVVKNYPLPAGLSADRADLLVRLPSSWPDGQPDMFWIDPAVRRTSDGLEPPAAASRESYLGRTWQRFSRHLGPGAWRPSDNLETWLTVVRQELTKAAE